MTRTRSSLLRRTYLSISPARQLRARFWVEVVLSLVCAVLFVVTLVAPDWIEAVFQPE